MAAKSSSKSKPAPAKKVVIAPKVGTKKSVISRKHR